MPEPVDAADDWAVITGAARKVSIAFYVVAKDSYATALKAKGTRDSRRVMPGDQPTTAVTWHLVKDAVLTERPPLNSKITSCGEVWYIQHIDADPDDKSWICSCILGK